MRIVFATNNKHKLEEIRKILGNKHEVLSLSDIGCHEDIPETGTTLEENALQKAEYIYNKYHLSCFADDTGLEVDALGGAPGVYSARYASLEGQGARGRSNLFAPSSKASLEKGQEVSHDSEANMNRLLRELGENNNRKARFRTVIALIISNEKREVRGEKQETSGDRSEVRGEKPILFEGIVNGTIARKKSGMEGFGYDPIFIPDGYDKSFAELGTEIKNSISHRAIATKKLTRALGSNE